MMQQHTDGCARKKEIKIVLNVPEMTGGLFKQGTFFETPRYA